MTPDRPGTGRSPGPILIVGALGGSKVDRFLSLEMVPNGTQRGPSGKLEEILENLEKTKREVEKLLFRSCYFFMPETNF